MYIYIDTNPIEKPFLCTPAASVRIPRVDTACLQYNLFLFVFPQGIYNNFFVAVAATRPQEYIVLVYLFI